MNCLVLLNARAGTLLSGGISNPVETVEAAFEDAGHSAEVRLVDPEGMGAALDEAVTSSHDTIIVGGGDGTFSHALEKLATSGKTLGVLPLGTMNLLGRDLGFPSMELGEMAEALANGEVRKFDLARINGRPFHTLCGLGYFSRVARAREQTRFNFPLGRLLSVIMSVWRSIMKTGRLRLSIDVDGRRIDARSYAALVTNNRIGNDWHRSLFSEGVLELHLMRSSHFAHRAKAGFGLIAGRWREGDAIESFAGHEITISSARTRVWLAVDGELRREPMPLRFTIEKAAIQMRVPAAAKLTDFER
jgi:diacylglycerol kinase family enzyme